MNSSADLWRERSRLSDQLRQARVVAGYTQEQAHAALGWSLSTLLSIECGQTAPSPGDLWRLIELYRVAETAPLEQSVRRTAILPRDAFRDVYQPHERRFVGAEGDACRIRQYELTLVPELLRTPAYAQAVIDDLALERNPRSLRERMLYACLARQRRLDRDRPPERVFVIEEQALHRPVGGPSVMTEQIGRLHEAGSVVRALPADGVHPGLAGSFTILDFPGDQRSVVYLTGLGHRALVAADQVVRYERLFDTAVPPSGAYSLQAAA